MERFAALYTTQSGFSDNLKLAVKLIKAFAASAVSIEVKGYARDAAKGYNLDDDDAVKELLSKPW